MNAMTKTRLLGVYRLFFMALGFVALSVVLYLDIQNPNTNLANLFSFFTIEANLLAAFTFLVTGVAALRSKEQTQFVMLRGFTTLAMTLTGIIYFLLLRGLEGQLQIPVAWVNTVLHYIIPAATLADWLVAPPAQRIAFSRSLIWVLFPALYVPYSLIRGAVVDWYPYPFLNARVQSYESIAITCAVMLVLVVGLAVGLAFRTRIGRQARTA